MKVHGHAISRCADPKPRLARIACVIAPLLLGSACAAARPLPSTPRLEQLTEESVFAGAPASEWPDVQPEDPAKASVDATCGLSPVLSNGSMYSAVSIKGRQMDGQVAPLNVALVLDRSGSMRGKPFSGMLTAAEAFINAFREGDKVSVVVFSDGVFEALPPVTINVQTRTDAVARIRSLHDGGGTWLSGGYLGGLSETFSQFSEWQVNQVVLFSDGQPNRGITDSNALFNMAARAAEHGVGTTTIGFGALHDELLMQGMADAGGGTYHYVDSAGAIANIFAREANSILRTAVRNTWAEIDLPAGLVVQDVIGWDYVVAGTKLYVFVGAVPYGEERYAVIKYAPNTALRTGKLNTAITYSDVNRRAKFGVHCEPVITQTGGKDKWVLDAAGHAEAAWGLSEAMGWADGGTEVYAISQISYTRDLLKVLRAPLTPQSLMAEDKMLEDAQARLGFGVAKEATGSFLSGGMSGLMNYGARTAEKTATAAVVDSVDKGFAPLVRQGLPFTFYGRAGTRYSARGQRSFKLYAPEKSNKYKQARFDAYVMMRVRAP